MRKTIARTLPGTLRLAMRQDGQLFLQDVVLEARPWKKGLFSRPRVFFLAP